MPHVLIKLSVIKIIARLDLFLDLYCIFEKKPKIYSFEMW